MHCDVCCSSLMMIREICWTKCNHLCMMMKEFDINYMCGWCFVIGCSMMLSSFLSMTRKDYTAAVRGSCTIARRQVIGFFYCEFSLQHPTALSTRKRWATPRRRKYIYLCTKTTLVWLTHAKKTQRARAYRSAVRGAICMWGRERGKVRHMYRVFRMFRSGCICMRYNGNFNRDQRLLCVVYAQIIIIFIFW